MIGVLFIFMLLGAGIAALLHWVYTAYVFRKSCLQLTWDATYRAYDKDKQWPEDIRAYNADGVLVYFAPTWYGDWWHVPSKTVLGYDKKDRLREAFNFEKSFPGDKVKSYVKAKRSSEGESGGDQSGASSHDADSAGVPA